jgi:arabinogalactan endo-1,4-beta-galactosidase
LPRCANGVPRLFGSIVSRLANLFLSRRLLRILAACMAAVAVNCALAQPSQSITVQPVEGLSPDFIMGADMSMLDQLERLGGKFYDQNGEPGDALRIAKDNGVNWVRLRLWHTPVNDEDVVANGRTVSRRGEPVGGGNNDLAATIRLAARAKALGLKFLLDIHYSDFWVDPEKQTKPVAWRRLGGAALEQEVYRYTSQVMAALREANALPDMVQIGNEVNGGLLWPDGKTWKAEHDDKIGGYDGFAALVSQGIKAVRDADRHRGSPQQIKVAVHLADGGDNTLYRRVFDAFTKRGVDFDVIGMSYYPYYHGPIEDLQANANDISARYGKEVVVMETAYAWTTRNGDAWPNLFNEQMQASVGYKASVQGQASLVRDVIAAMAQVPGRRGLGVFYWEPDWIPVPGAGWRTGEGNSWDNQAMFDFDGRALPSLAVFARVRRGAASGDAAAQVPHVIDGRPLRFHAFVGESWTPPASVRLAFSDDAERLVHVDWNAVPSEALGHEGRFALHGVVKGRADCVVADVEIAPRRNLIEDAGFEKGDLRDWEVAGDAAFSNERNPGNAHGGVRSLHYWSDKPFKAEISHTVSGLKDGRYTLRAWAAGAGGETALQLFARDCGGAALKATAMANTGWQKWRQYVVPGIQVSGGRCTAGISVDGPTGTWGNIDDIEFVREDAAN